MVVATGEKADVYLKRVSSSSRAGEDAEKVLGLMKRD